MAVELQRHLFTIGDFQRMLEAGIFREDDRVELINGEILQMTPIGSRHAACVDRFNGLLNQRLGAKAIVRVQSPVRLGEHSEPQPDLALLRPRADFYAGAHPGAKDVLLVVEVAETSAEADRAAKIPLYARAGIPEVWLVNLDEETIEVYCRPSPDGYRETRALRRGQQLFALTIPNLDVAVGEILGEANTPIS